MLSETKLVWELQCVNKIALSLSTTLDLYAITHLATEGIVQHFDCVFARIWLVEPDQKTLRLRASSGLYTHLDGASSKIPMGESKIGRIAQNRIALLSNHLASESWVKHPDWVIEQKINGFAGYPLIHENQVLGVLAAFSRKPMSPEFLEVLSSLCTTLTVAIQMANLHQREMQKLQANNNSLSQATLGNLTLSETLAKTLGQTPLSVLGAERRLDLKQTQLLLQMAQKLKVLDCNYCRLIYEDDWVALEAIAAGKLPSLAPKEHASNAAQDISFYDLSAAVSALGGTLTMNREESIKAIQLSMQIPITPVATETAAPKACSTLLASSINSIENASQSQRYPKLSKRENEVMELLAIGLRDRNIAHRLHISDSTVKFHIHNILTKLESKTRLQALYKLMRTDGLNL
ncbi:MAG: LuxR C-terminal-related transcriptional regulator [Phormidesmis sp.]